MNTPSAPAITVERLHGAVPILTNVSSHSWENKVVFNPACALVTSKAELAAIIPALPFNVSIRNILAREPALCFLLYRAQGQKAATDDFARSSIGLAVLSADLRLLVRYDKPVLLPDRDYDNLGVEDGRITKAGDRYVMFYTAYGKGTAKNEIRIAIASSRDFVRWEKHGLLRGSFNSIDNKNAMLFEQGAEGKVLMLHRPMEGTDAMAIHWAESDDIFGIWHSRGALLKPRPNPLFIDTWIGGGAPPLRLHDGRILLLYHIGNRKADQSREYDLGLALLDLTRKDPVVRRLEPLMRPEASSETQGDPELGVNNVLFVCGAYFYGGDLYFPYAGADSVILGGKIPGAGINRFIAS